MPELVKATLAQIGADPEDPKILAGPVEVQFNPTTLKLQVETHVDGGRDQSRAKPGEKQQYVYTGSRTLTLELVFDSADEGTTERPRSVRERTQFVESFAIPRTRGNENQVPPRVRFQWGEFVLDGVVRSIGVDFEHFAANGTPLRARCSLAITEQDPRFQQLAIGPGANRAPSLDVRLSGALGTAGSGSQRSALALGGETAADFAARMGLDPAAWRGLAAGIESPLALPAGLEIGFEASVGVGLGVGVAAGVAAGASASLEARFGLEAAGAASAGAVASPAFAAGFSLAAAGGVGTAIESVKLAQAATGQREARAAFAVSTTGAPPAVPARPAMPAQARAPLARTGLPGPTSVAQPAPEPPRADLRAVSFGLGVPLRPTLGRAVRLRARGSASEPPSTDDPTVPRWRELPERERTAAAASARRHGAGCGCGCQRRRG